MEKVGLVVDRPSQHNLVPGYHGCYLRVDVGSGRAERVPLTEDILRAFIGGSGLGTYLMLREGVATADPLSAEAVLAFVFSPLVGSPLTTSAKFAVVSKSPLTGRLNDSLASSGFALQGKKCGCDAICLWGKAPEPSVLVIDDGQVRLMSAGHLWGTTTVEAERLLREALGNDYQIATIGPAGERQVRYATISHNQRHAGRGGSGAVLGAKRIKAVAVRGHQRCNWAQADVLAELAKQLSQKSFGPATAKYRELGTASNLLLFNRLAALPTSNFRAGSFEGVEGLAPEQLGITRERTRAYCAACTIGCEHIYSLEEDKKTGGKGVRLEYENLFALGPLCAIGDPEVVLQASRRCDELGLDTISAGGTIAFAMECAERGLLEADGLQFGDGPGLLRILEAIAHREGLGDLLAEGSRCLAERVGQGSLAFAPQVKGLEIPGYEPRALQTMALGFAVGARGADHNRSGAYEVDFSLDVDRRDVKPEDAHRAVETEDRAALIDSLILCKFIRGVFADLFAESAEMLGAVSGWELTSQELHTCAERIVTAKKWFNILAGWTPAEDTLPERFLSEPLVDDASATLSPERLRALITAYNTARGWSPEGRVADVQLDALGLTRLLPMVG